MAEASLLPTHKLRKGSVSASDSVSHVVETDLTRSCGEKNAEEEDGDLQSLEYEDDCLYAIAAANPTPSFDEEVAEDEYDLWTTDPDLYAELHLSESDTDIPSSSPGRASLIKRVQQAVRKVKYEHLRKRMSKRTGEEPPSVISPEDLELAGLTEEEKEQKRLEWQKELSKVEEEIETLRSVLKSKVQLAQKLKKKLGFTMWRELSEDFSQSVRTVKETSVYQSVEAGIHNVTTAIVQSPVYQNVEEKISHVGKVVVENPVYQKTESVVKGAAESTRTILGGLTGGFSNKMGQIKNSESFRSLEDKVGSAYENVKTRVSSRSSSIQSFDDALRDSSVHESKPLS